MGMPQERAFNVEVEDEAVGDATAENRNALTGGTLYKQFFKAVCVEVQAGQAPLFVRAGSNTETSGDTNPDDTGTQPLYVPNTGLECPELTQQPLELHYFMGRLIGVAIRTSVPLALHLPRSIWKRLVGEPVTQTDVFQTDTDCNEVAAILESMESMGVTKANFESLTSMYFMGRQSDGRMVELFPGGAETAVTFERRKEYARTLRAMRMAEGQVQVEAIRSGLYELVPKEALSLFTWIELRELVCKAVPLAPSLACLQERAVYGGGLSADSTHIQRFWRVLHNMDQVDFHLVTRFLLGACGCRIPSLRFVLPSSDELDQDQQMPVVDLNSRTFILPKFSTDDIMRKQLVRASIRCFDLTSSEGKSTEEGSPTASAAATELETSMSEETRA